MSTAWCVHTCTACACRSVCVKTQGSQRLRHGGLEVRGGKEEVRFQGNLKSEKKLLRVRRSGEA